MNNFNQNDLLPQTLEEAIATARAKDRQRKDAERKLLEQKQELWYKDALSSFELPFSEHLISLIKPEYRMHVYNQGIQASDIGVKASFNFKGLTFEVYKRNPHNPNPYSERSASWLVAAWKNLQDEEPLEACELNYLHVEAFDRELLLFIGCCLEELNPEPLNIDFSEELF